VWCCPRDVRTGDRDVVKNSAVQRSRIGRGRRHSSSLRVVGFSAAFSAHPGDGVAYSDLGTQLRRQPTQSSTMPNAPGPRAFDCSRQRISRLPAKCLCVTVQLPETVRSLAAGSTACVG
jgi:hypothetical protein